MVTFGLLLDFMGSSLYSLDLKDLINAHPAQSKQSGQYPIRSSSPYPTNQLAL
jgi:hypothetical protein